MDEEGEEKKKRVKGDGFQIYEARLLKVVGMAVDPTPVASLHSTLCSRNVWPALVGQLATRAAWS